MWCFVAIQSSFQVWFSDGMPISVERGGHGVSSRLIVDQKGFLDITVYPPTSGSMVDVNGSSLQLPRDLEGPPSADEDSPRRMELSLEINGDGSFELGLIGSDPLHLSRALSVSGTLKPLPRVSAEDANFISTMTMEDYVPYPDISDAPGLTVEEIKALGLKLFPFSPYSFQLAMCVYDWTTASFTRMVLMKIFEYTGLPPEPFPVDRNSIAREIWASNWESYTPQNTAFMRSFLMKPADSLDNVEVQLSFVAEALQNFSSVENRLLSAAMQALPRTSVFEHAQLFSGQLDIYQLGLDHFGIEFLECPLNDGPVGEELVTSFAGALATFASAGKIITTKMVWSFADSLQDAMHYSNGIVLVANMPSDSVVWDKASYITGLSDDPKKIEYTFMPGTQFEVQGVDNATVDGKQIVVIILQPHSSSEQALARHAISAREAGRMAARFQVDEIMDIVKQYTPMSELPHSRNKAGGRRCACADTWRPARGSAPRNKQL